MAKYTGIDLEQDLNWQDFEEHATSEHTRSRIERLKDLISIEDARFLLRQLSNLDNPEEVKELFVLQKLQNDWGGSFYGAIPEQIPEEDTIPVPTDFENLVRAALCLAEIHYRNYEAISNTGWRALQFRNETFPRSEVQSRSRSIRLDLDISGIQRLLELFTKDSVTIDEAMKVVNHPAFTEMIKHRRSLGYIPKPWITKKRLGKFIQRAVSHEPLDMIWKWLNPWNLFGLADISMNLEKYQRLLDTISFYKDDMVNQVLRRISMFAPKDVVFRDRCSFAVGWGVRGWATRKMCGVNIEHFKDDFQLLIRTISHETFHRLQLHVCPIDSSKKNRHPKFDDLVHYPFPDKKDRKFYEVLTYIFLEGSATFVGGVSSESQTEKKTIEGLKLLREIHRAIYEETDFEKTEKLLNSGLKSNGPFYALGYHMTNSIVDKYSSSAIGESLLEGSSGFFKRYFEAHRGISQNRRSEFLLFGRKIKEKVNELGSRAQKELQEKHRTR